MTDQQQPETPAMSFVHYGDPSAPEGLDRAAYVYPSPVATEDTPPFFADRPRPAPVSALRAMALNLILPGAGHWHLGRRAAGGALLVTTVMLVIAEIATGLFARVLVAYCPAAAIWAALSARRINAGTKKRGAA